MEGDIGKVKEVLSNNIKIIDEKDTENGYTPLHYAVEESKKDIVNELLKNRENANITDRKEMTPIYKAVMYGNQELVRILAESGADPNIPNINGIYPIHNAVTFGYLEIVKILLDSKAEPRVPNHEGKTAFEVARNRIHILVQQ